MLYIANGILDFRMSLYIRGFYMLSKGQYTVKTRVAWYSVYTSNPLNAGYHFLQLVEHLFDGDEKNVLEIIQN